MVCSPLSLSLSFVGGRKTQSALNVSEGEPSKPKQMLFELSNHSQAAWARRTCHLFMTCQLIMMRSTIEMRRKRDMMTREREIHRISIYRILACMMYWHILQAINCNCDFVSLFLLVSSSIRVHSHSHATCLLSVFYLQSISFTFQQTSDLFEEIFRETCIKYKAF